MFGLGMVSKWANSLETGKPFRKWVSVLTKIIGIIIMIAVIIPGIVMVLSTIGMRSFGYGNSPIEIAGSVLVLILNIILAIILFKLFWCKADKIKELGDQTHFTLIPITVLLTRLFGEICFVVLIVSGFQTLINSIFGSSMNLGRLWRGIPYLPFLGYHGIVGGLITFVVFSFLGAILLVYSYFIAEQINLLVDVASNVRKIQKNYQVAGE